MRTRYPLINLRLLIERNVAIAIIVSIFMSLGTYHVMLLFAPLMALIAWRILRDESALPINIDPLAEEPHEAGELGLGADGEHAGGFEGGEHGGFLQEAG